MNSTTLRLGLPVFSIVIISVLFAGIVLGIGLTTAVNVFWFDKRFDDAENQLQAIDERFWQHHYVTPEPSPGKPDNEE